MKSPLSALPTSIVEEIVHLESEAMIPLLKKIGIQLTVDGIRKSILADPSQTVLVCQDGQRLTALVRYTVESDHIFIKSIQLAKSREGLRSLRDILSTSLRALQSEASSKVQSVAQTSNQSSIVLHERLGFRRIQENSKAIRFESERSDLVERLKRILRSPSTSEAAD